MTTTTTTLHVDPSPTTSHTPRHGNSTTQQQQRPDEQTDQLLIVRLAGVQSLYQDNKQNQQQQQHVATRASSSPSLLASMDAGMVHGHGSTSSHGNHHHHDYGTDHTSNDNGNDTMMLPPELEWLQLLADERPLVSCQLLARQVPLQDPSSPASASSHGSNNNNNKNINKKNRAKNNQHLFMGDTSSSSSLSSPHKRPIPGMEQQSRQRLFWEEEHRPQDTTRSDYSGSSSSSFLSKDDEEIEDVPPQMAIGRLYYRPSSSSFWNGLKDWIFPTDVAVSLIQMGRASVASDGLLISSSSTYYRIEDTTESVRDLQRDVQYMEGLQAAEYQAVAEQRGVWQLPAFRNVRADVVKEVEFQTTAPWYQKVWRWMRGG